MPGFFSEDLLDDIRSANSIHDVVSEQLSLKKSGRNFKGLCPFHAEKTPSFTVNTEKQIFHCFGCGEGGNVFSFVMKQQSMSFPEAVRYLAKKGGVAIPETLPRASLEKVRERDRLLSAMASAVSRYRTLLKGREGQAALAYLRKRGVTDETIEAFALGWAPTSWDSLLKTLRAEKFTEDELVKAGLAVPRNVGGGHRDRFRSRVLFPIYDLQGQAIAFGGRIIGEGEPKYLNSPETPLYNKSRSLFGLNAAREGIRKEGYGVVVEGYFDCLSAHQGGCTNVIATSGTALTEDHLRLMKRYSDRWTVVFDGDAAGVRAARRSLELFVTQGVFARAVLLPEDEDPDGLIQKEGPDAFRRLLDGAESLMDFFLRSIAAEHPVRKVEGKVAALREVAPLLAKVKGRVERDEYINLAADRLGIKEEVLRSEVSEAGQKKTAPRGTAPETSPAPTRTYRSEEVVVVRALLAGGDAAARIRKEVSLEDLENEDCRAIAARVFSLIDEGITKNLGDRLNLEDRRLNSLVASWLIDSGYMADEETALQAGMDGLTRIKSRKADHESRRLRGQIAEAEKTGDREALYRLLKMKQELRLPAK